jgi:hypothetical protein
MSIGSAPDCMFCKHLLPAEDDTSPLTCAAFPREIPREIFFEGVSHRKPYPNDKGIRFELVAGGPESYRER